MVYNILKDLHPRAHITAVDRRIVYNYRPFFGRDKSLHGIVCKNK